MRARMALKQASIACDIVEISLRDKPPEMLAISPKGTVPVLLLSDGTVIDESRNIMDWALNQFDPDNWLVHDISLIKDNDSWFKHALDRYKYPARYPQEDCTGAQETVLKFLTLLNDRLIETQFLSQDFVTLSDIAIFPFIRQAVNTDKDWFLSLPLSKLQKWLDYCLNMSIFTHIMNKNLTNI